MTDVVITGAARTPVGRFMGGLGALPAHTLGAVAVRAALDRSNIAPSEVDEVILGQVLVAGQGQNPARQAALEAGVPVGVTAIGVNQMCGSGLRAVALAAQGLMAGDVGVMIAGGQESMSLAPHCAYLRAGARMGDLVLVDTIQRDGLVDAFHGGPMGLHTEILAERYGIGREQQDEFALRSQRRACAAIEEGRFAAEIVPVTVTGRKGERAELTTDEGPRPETSRETLARLRPSFKEDGTITPGNASGLNDGASAVALMREREATRRGLAPLARIASWATVGVDPTLFGEAPVPASRRALEKADWRVADLDLVESNEAFAAQSLVVIRGLGLDPEKVNVNGGAIALGHPLGASGARILVTLIHELRRRGGGKGLATLCIGGGMGIALCIEVARA